MTKVIDTLTQEDFDGAFQKLLERYNKYIGAGGDYFSGDKSFMCVLSIKVPIRKKSGNSSYALRICAFCLLTTLVTPFTTSTAFISSLFRKSRNRRFCRAVWDGEIRTSNIILKYGVYLLLQFYRCSHNFPLSLFQ